MFHRESPFWAFQQNLLIGYRLPSSTFLCSLPQWRISLCLWRLRTRAVFAVRVLRCFALLLRTGPMSPFSFHPAPNYPEFEEAISWCLRGQLFFQLQCLQFSLEGLRKAHSHSDKIHLNDNEFRSHRSLQKYGIEVQTTLKCCIVIIIVRLLETCLFGKCCM